VFRILFASIKLCYFRASLFYSGSTTAVISIGRQSSPLVDSVVETSGGAQSSTDVRRGTPTAVKSIQGLHSLTNAEYFAKVAGFTPFPPRTGCRYCACGTEILFGWGIAPDKCPECIQRRRRQIQQESNTFFDAKKK
jgi:hypothetical protein